MKDTKDYYDKMAADWAKRGYAADAALACLDEFCKRLPQNGRVLDLCCGAGYESMRIKEKGFQVVGIDYSEESLKIARKRNPGINFYQDNLLHNYSYIGSVDGILCIAGLVHIESRDLKQAFHSMYSVLNKDGIVLVSICEGSGKIHDRSICMIDGEEYDRNFIAHNLEELKDAIAGLFCYITELESDMESWHYYLFRKIEE
ncbi:methyltransferase [Lachnospiraceae bacterium KM106-2]|nr:methyltransferase [Lachnospiraceae bacterium KM106-2]